MKFRKIDPTPLKNILKDKKTRR